MIKYNHEATRILRLSKGLSPQEFANRIGGKTQRQHVYMWEDKKAIPHTKTLVAIANAFGLTTLDLFFTSDNYHGNNQHTNSVNTAQASATSTESNEVQP